MNEAKHTPGPLKVARLFVENQPEQFAVATGKWKAPIVAICPREDDATLFAQAPTILRQRDEALAALKAIADNLENRAMTGEEQKAFDYNPHADSWRCYLSGLIIQSRNQARAVIAQIESGVGK